MFNRLTLTNFQKHKDLSIALDPEVTVIGGPTEAGKSTILRALKWLCLNEGCKPLIRVGAKSAKVELEVDGHKIVRERKGTENTYTLDGKPYKAFGTSVPPDITNILRVTPTNFQDQQDPAFWISLSAPQRSRELNQIVNLGAIDEALASVASELRKAKTAVEVSEDRLKTAQDKTREIVWVHEADEALRMLELQAAAMLAKAARIDSLSGLIRDLQRVEETRASGVQGLSEGEKLVSRGLKLEKRRNRVETLTKLINDLLSVEDDEWDAKERLERAQNELSQVRTCPACGNPVRS